MDGNRYLRRAITVPVLCLGWVCLLAASPVLLVIAMIFDALRRGDRARPSPTTRALAFFLVYLSCEVFGVAMATWIWVVARLRRVDEARFLSWNFWLQCAWTRTLYRAAVRIYGTTIEVDGLEAISPGPILLFMRHTSVADTVLPGVFVSGQLGVRLRYVLKRELLADPCLDIVGMRLRNHFVRRANTNAETQAHEIAAVGALAKGLSPDEGVLIYPEGTRYSEARRRQRLERLREAGDPMITLAESMTRVLPPQLGGPLALVDAAARSGVSAVVFCAHVGFEGAASMPRFLGGALIGARVRLGFWRVPLAEVPPTDEARRVWLYEQWKRVDDWVVQRS